MKNSLKYLKLWQQKRSELPISNDPQSDWQDMQRLLDQHLPVSKPVGNTGSLVNSATFKLLSGMLIVAASVTVIYFAAHKNEDKQQKVKPALKDSIVSMPVSNDSTLNNKNSYTDKTDSLHSIKQSVTVNPATSVQTDSSTIPHSGNRNNISGVLNKDISVLKNRNKNRSAINGRNNSGQYVDVVNSKREENGKHTSITKGSNSSARLNANNAQVLTGINESNGQEGGQAALNSTVKSSQRDAYLETYAPSKPVINFNELNSATANKTKPSMDKSHMIAGTGFSKIKINKVKTGKSSKIKAPKTATPLDIDWGILAGANSSGVSKLPADLYFGAFTTFNIKNNWAVNMQIRVFSPQNASGTYTHANESKKDTSLKLITIKDSRKIYSVEIPVYMEYKVSDNIRLKAGPVISLPIKQSGGSSFLQPDSIKKDTAYHAKINSQLANTKYQQKINYGISAGASIHVNRFIFEVTYLKRLNSQKVSSDLGSYTSSGSTFQFTVGFKLNKGRH